MGKHQGRASPHPIPTPKAGVGWEPNGQEVAPGVGWLATDRDPQRSRLVPRKLFSSGPPRGRSHAAPILTCGWRRWSPGRGPGLG